MSIFDILMITINQKIYLCIVNLLFALLLNTLFFSGESFSQSHNHWTRSFNEESSLLSGAVVGGGAGPSAIYYNPSSISEITESKFSLNASLFSLHFYKIKNALGDGIDLPSIRGIVEPRFLSFMVRPKKRPEWSFEFAFLNNENYKLEFTTSVDKNLDVINYLPGQERYFAMFQYENIYRDDWFGAGSSFKLNPYLFFGGSMFVSVRSLEYHYLLDIETYPIDDSIVVDNQLIPFYSANYQETDYIKFTNYQLLWKVGMLYKKGDFSVGFSVTTPSVNLFADAKKVSRKEKQSNIRAPGSDEFLLDFVVVDYKEKQQVKVNYKSPLSFAAGLTYHFPDKQKTFYATIEFFSGIDPYRIVWAEENPYLLSGTVHDEFPFEEWLTFVSGAKPVFNAALGYRWSIKENIMLLAGFRTDFNYRKNLDYKPFLENKEIKGLDLDLYHLTGGLTVTVLGHDIITGLQYSIGRQRNQKQFINLSNPDEFNPDENASLVGTRANTMNTFYNSISLYFGAIINFGVSKKQ